jgi:hypothetical protein
VARLGGVCTVLRYAELDFRQSGQVVPVMLDLDLDASDPQRVYDIDASVRTITKNARRGMSHVLCRQVHVVALVRHQVHHNHGNDQVTRSFEWHSRGVDVRRAASRRLQLLLGDTTGPLHRATVRAGCRCVWCGDIQRHGQSARLVHRLLGT